MMKKDSIVSWPFKIDETEKYAYWDDAFTEEECDNIVSIGKKKKLYYAEIHSDHDMNSDKRYRDSKINFLSPNDCPFVFPKLANYVVSLNERFFNFDLWGFAEGLQFTVYSEPGQQYKKHTDSGMGIKIRKLSVVLQLTNEDDYEGGDLELYYSEEPTKLNRKKGTLFVFPSYMLHAVKPVTKGTRYSLVGWVNGPSFK